MKSMKVVILNGSLRAGNYTSMASALVADELRKHPAITVHVVNPADYELIFPGEEPTAGVQRLREEVRDADAIVLATPEYHGGISSVMKAVIENLDHPSALAGKPVALLGVAAGAIGAIKSLEMLRGIAAHVGAIVLPQAVSVAGVQSKFSPDGKVLDAEAEKSIRGLSRVLLKYLHDTRGSSLEIRPTERQEAAARAN